MFKVNNKDTGILIVNLTYFTPCSSGSIVDSEQVNVGWLYYSNDKIKSKLLVAVYNIRQPIDRLLKKTFSEFT